jgi:hypothetical protein
LLQQQHRRETSVTAYRQIFSGRSFPVANKNIGLDLSDATSDKAVKLAFRFGFG